MKSNISLILLLFITIGYSEPEVIKRDNEPDFILTKDKKMDFAIKEAKSKVDEFIQRIKSTKNHEGFFIKKAFTYGKDEA